MSRSSEILPAPHSHFYRNRLLYPLAWRRGRVEGGFYKRGSHDLVNVEECKIQDAAITSIAERVKGIVQALELPIASYPGVVSDADRTPQPGGVGMRALAIRIAPGTGQVLVGFVTTGGVEPRLRELAEKSLAAGEGLKSSTGFRTRVKSIVRNIQDENGNVLLGRKSLPLLGNDHIEDLYMGMKFRVSMTSFFQPNSAAARAAVREIVANVKQLAGKRVVDAYAGIGVMALALASVAEKVVAIEEVKSSVRDGRVNATLNGLTNVEFLEGAVEARLHDAFSGSPVDYLVLDPPRAGLSPASLEAVVARKPRRVAYLSCAMDSFARDLTALAGDYTIRRVMPFDFLPQTDHVEALALLDAR